MDHLQNPEAPERKPSPSLGYLAVSRGTHLPSNFAMNMGIPENGLQDDSSHQISNGIHENLHTPVAVPPSQSPLSMITQGDNWVQANGFARKHLQSGASNFQVVKKRREGESPCQNGDHSFRAYPQVSCLRASCPTPPLSPRHMPPPQQVPQAVQMQGMTSFQGILGSDLGYGQLQSGNLVQSQAGPHLGLGPAQNYMQREPPEARRAALREWGNRPLSMVDPDLWEMMEKEKIRQWKGIELIASENFASQALLEALGSHLTNKYSEGLPGARYYGGNEHIDEIERLCCKRALDAFHLRPEEWGVNVQLYSCTSANFAVYTGLLQPKDRIMGLDTPSGGHLSHGYYTPSGKKISSASIFFENFPYKVDSKTGLIDYDGLEEKAKDYRPRILICGGSAYPREWKYERLREIADKCGAILMCDMAQISGLVAAEACDTPFKYCDIVTSTTHKSLRGPRGGMIFYRKGLKPRKKSSSQVSDEGGVYDFEDKINFAVFPSLQGGPHNNHIAALAVALKQVSSPEYKTYIQQVKSNAQALAAALQRKQCTLVTGGTDNHLLLWDLRPLGLTGSCYEKVCERCHITLNKNAVFGDSGGQGPGGVRIGTQAMTSRGCIESDFEMIANYLYRAVKITRAIQKEKENGTLKGFEKALLNNKEIAELRMEVEQFASSFDMPGFDVTSMR